MAKHGVPPELPAMRLPIQHQGNGSRHRGQIPRRVRSQLQINQRGLDPAVAQPPAQVVQRDSVEQHVPGIAVPQRVGSNTRTLGELAGLSGLSITG